MIWTLVGFCIGAGFVYFWWSAKHHRIMLETQHQYKGETENQNTELRNENIRLKTELEKEKEHFADKTKMIAELQVKFENVSQKIFKEQIGSFKQDSQILLGSILEPLRGKIEHFNQKVEDYYVKEGKDIQSLKTEIQGILQAKIEITKATENLTNALKGDTKIQGNWGEMILTKILEASGLREGEEYILQGKDLQIKSEDGSHLKPDVIVNLPDGKHLVIDSKVSLTNYEAFVSSSDEGVKKDQLGKFLQSVKTHIQALSAKKYHSSEKLSSPEITLMFLPMEGAFSLALQNDKDLYLSAWDKGIVMVSPTTLLATLRTIESLWKRERQNNNAKVIAEEAGKMYDKLVGFVTDLEDVGKSLQKTHHSYDLAMNKLTTGRGNLVDRAEKLKELGAKASKQISNKFLDEDSSAENAIVEKSL